jgi:hypothetical protein
METAHSVLFWTSERCKFRRWNQCKAHAKASARVHQQALALLFLLIFTIALVQTDLNKQRKVINFVKASNLLLQD